ncbi:MAG: aspartate kinase [Bacillota bacterium]|nr:aspartate kinase [Bacillota bacterium]
MLTVQKFGGSSVADAGRIRRVADIIAETKAAGSDVVAVLSAAGDTTDELADRAAEISKFPPHRELDALLSTGELQSVALMSMQLERLGVPALSLSGRQAGIITDENHGNAKILNIKTKRIKDELARGKVVVVAGFQGIDCSDNITTLGRGGSDTTAVALAAALKADKCEIYSDVDGIYTADPRLVTGAKKLSEIDYTDMLNLARGGSQVMHSRAVEIAMKYNMEVRMLSSFVKTEGTYMRRLVRRPELCGITRDKAENKISLVGEAADINCLSVAAALLKESGIFPISAEAREGVCSLTTEDRFVLPALQLLHKHFFD